VYQFKYTGQTNWGASDDYLEVLDVFFVLKSILIGSILGSINLVFSKFKLFFLLYSSLSRSRWGGKILFWRDLEFLSHEKSTQVLC